MCGSTRRFSFRKRRPPEDAHTAAVSRFRWTPETFFNWSFRFFFPFLHLLWLLSFFVAWMTRRHMSPPTRPKPKKKKRKIKSNLTVHYGVPQETISITPLEPFVCPFNSLDCIYSFFLIYCLFWGFSRSRCACCAPPHPAAEWMTEKWLRT